VNTAIRFDLQSRSTYSDGALAPDEVVARAARAGVEMLALTDHDTVDGVAEAVAAGDLHGIRVVPAVEVTVLDGDRGDLHLLGYGIDPQAAGLQQLLEDPGRTGPTITDAIVAVHAAGGVAVWAHPFWDIDAPSEVLAAIERFAAQGLDGVEAFYPTFTCEQTRLLVQASAERRLLTTGSADFQGPDHPRFNSFLSFDRYGLDPQLGPLLEPAPAGKHPSMRIWQREPLNAEPAPDLLSIGAITDGTVFYVRSHGPAPTIDPSAHRLIVAGLVEAPFVLDLAELRSLGERRSVTATLQCAGNRRRELFDVRPIDGEIPWGPGVIGTAVWGGVSLVDVLAQAGVRADASHVELVGGDLDPQGRSFGGSIPVAKALSPEVLLATTMNGEPLTPAHGAPLRAIVPGYIGARSVKWLREINVLNGPSHNHYQAVSYRVHPPSVTDRHADPSKAIPLGEIAVNAAILTPGDGARLPAGEIVIGGYAISGGANRIERVDVSADAGETWHCAELLDPPSPWAWRRWRIALDLPAGHTNLVARAIDSALNTQPENPADLWNVQGYANNARPTVRLQLV
jgi:sulfite oxidase